MSYPIPTHMSKAAAYKAISTCLAGRQATEIVAIYHRGNLVI